MKISITARTNVGYGRDNNEDAYVFCPSLDTSNWKQDSTNGYVDLHQHGALIVVADGMGGLNAGEVAAATAVETIREVFAKKAAELTATPDDKTSLHIMGQAIEQADEAIKKRIYEDPDTAGMGTTIVVTWVQTEKTHVAWCGDSRCYLYNDDHGLLPLTKDHSYVQELVDSGQITPEEAFNHPDNNVITRGLGDFDTPLQPDFASVDTASGNTLLLCSDGLCGYCTDEQIAQTLQDSRNNTAACADGLVQLALDADGQDNICVAVATVLSNDDAPRESWLKRLMKKLFN